MIGLWPFPICHASNEIVIRAPFVTICKWLNPELLKNFQGLKYANLCLVT